MNAAEETADVLRERANDLYWNSEDTVDQVAERLGMSRNAIYTAVRPIAADVPCPDCGEPLVFANRSSRTHGKATCESCDTERVLPNGVLDESELKPGAGELETAPVPGRLEHWKEELAALPPERAALIGGAAALGVAVGAVAVKAVRGRS